MRAFVAVLLITSTALAQPLPEHLKPQSPPSIALMDTQMRQYLGGELQESYAWAALGLAGLAASIPLFISGDKVGQGFSVPVFGFALVQLALGIGLWVRTPSQIASLSAQLREDPAAFAVAERTRMRGVNRWFPAYKIVELAVMLAGATLLANGVVSNDRTMLGVGAGLMVESGLFLVLDYFAEHRAAGYEAALIDFGH